MHSILIFIIITLAIIIGILIGGIVTYYLLNKKQKEIASLQNSSLTTENSFPLKENVSEKISFTPEKQEIFVETKCCEDLSLMSVETKVKIIQKLEKFEESGLFTNKNLSLPYLAAHLETNTKYLSRVIKNYKNTDFNAYINKLRIDYILRKLNDNKDFRHF